MKTESHLRHITSDWIEGFTFSNF